MNFPLPAFAGYGVELEYMIVDRATLSVLPVADTLLRQEGRQETEIPRGQLAWSNELALHVVELKNAHPSAILEGLAESFQAEVRAINRALEPMGGRLMPGAMHPWMDPRCETRLWPHRHAEIYRAYDRIFDCSRHGWANLQSMHLNLPFADDGEFARLHAAIRLVLPILPAIAASSPIVEGGAAGWLDFRMEAYRTHPIRVPSLIGQVIPETSQSEAGYRENVLDPMYRDIGPLDPEGVLRHEWLNCRGAIPRFDRNAIEIRVIDVQECPAADMAVAALTSGVVRACYEERWASLADQQGYSTRALADIMGACIQDGQEAFIEDGAYLALLGFPERACAAGELWRHLCEATADASPPAGRGWRKLLSLILEQGPLARRILQAVGGDFSRARLEEVYRDLCDCLAEGRMFEGKAE